MLRDPQSADQLLRSDGSHLAAPTGSCGAPSGCQHSAGKSVVSSHGASSGCQHSAGKAAVSATKRWRARNRTSASRRAETRARKNKKYSNWKTWKPLVRRRLNGKTSISADRKHFYDTNEAKKNCLQEVVTGIFEHASEIRKARNEPLRDLALERAGKWLREIADKLAAQQPLQNAVISGIRL